jgi:hypothetical protein
LSLLISMKYILRKSVFEPLLGDWHKQSGSIRRSGHGSKKLFLLLLFSELLKGMWEISWILLLTIWRKSKINPHYYNII